MSESERDPRILPWPGPPGPPGSRPPPGAWPPCPPGPGPWPRPPDFFSALYWLNAAYDDVTATKAFLRKLIADMFADDPTMIPGMGVAGVTDGSAAQPGQVGEFVVLAQTLTALAAQNQQPQTHVLGTLPPGDWNVWATFVSSALVNQVNYWLNPAPAGLNPAFLQGVFETAGLTIVYVPTNQTQLTSAQPSLIAFSVMTNVPADTPYTLYFMARRMR